jgi:hypothetical protein
MRCFFIGHWIFIIYYGIEYYSGNCGDYTSASRYPNNGWVNSGRGSSSLPKKRDSDNLDKKDCCAAGAGAGAGTDTGAGAGTGTGAGAGAADAADAAGTADDIISPLLYINTATTVLQESVIVKLPSRFPSL